MALLKSIWTVIWKLLAFLIAWAIPLALLIVPFHSHLKQIEQTKPYLIRLYLEFSAVTSIVLAAYLMVTIVDKRPFQTLGFEIHRLSHDAWLGITIGLFWLVTSLGILWLGGWVVPQQSNPISLSMLMLGSIALLLNTITQEILIRGYLFQTVQTHFGITIAVIVSSLLFATFHIGAVKDSGLAALNVFGAGILFGVAYAVSRNLWLPIAIHFAWNCVLGPVLGLSISGQNPFRVTWQLLKLEGPAFLTGGNFGLEGSIIVTATTAVVIGSLILGWR